MNKLTLIQSELKAPKNNYNSFGKYKYRNCEDILEAVKPLLKKYECTITIDDSIKEVVNIPYVESKITFSDGENTIEVSAQAGIDVNRKGMDIAQSFGSSSSYARKYALSGLFLIDDNKDVDSITKKTPVKVEQPKTKETLDSSHESFFKALKAVQSGNTTIAKIEEHYEITPEALKLLKDAE